jgi:hypothetical protein
VKTDPWHSPFSGLAYFFSHPSLWGWALLGTLVSGTITLFVCIKVVAWTFPEAANGVWGLYFWHVMKALGWGLFALVLMISIVFPLIFNGCFAKGFSVILKREKIVHSEESLAGAIASSFWVFFRTLKWRILWPLLLLAALLFLPFLIFPLSLIAANHLVVIESADLILSLFGKQASTRVHWISRHGTECFAAALSGTLLSFLLSLTVVGWLLWIPAMYCGVFLWIKNEPPSNESG